MVFLVQLETAQFVSQVIIGAPTLQQRKEILSALFEKMPVSPALDTDELAQRTTGYVGADLCALCREAAMNAIREMAKVIESNTDDV